MGSLRRMLYVQGNRLIAQLLTEVGLPVPLQAGCVQAVEHALQHRKRHGNKELERRRTKACATAIRISFACSMRSVVAPDNSAHLLKVQSSGNGGPGGTVINAKKPFNLLRRLTMNSRYHFMTSAALIDFPQHRAGANHLNRMRLEQKRSDDAEVSAAAANRPEQVAVLARAGDHEASIGQYHIGREQIVDRQAVIAASGSPVPPPSVSPPTPVVEMIPDGTASPNA